MNGHYDVVVVGARVAGAATALHLARAGHRVAVVDRSGPPADTTSTHALMRTGVLQLKRMGVFDRIVEAGTPAIQEIKLVFGSQEISFPVADEFGVDAYYAPRRTVLDTILIEEAVAAGAEFHSGVSVTDVSRDDSGRVNGIYARVGHGESWTPAQHVTGADGRQSLIARRVGAEVIRSNRPDNIVVYGYFGDVDATGYDFRFVDHHNVGLIPTNDDLTLVFSAGARRDAPRDGGRFLKQSLRQVAPDLADLVETAPRVGRLHRSESIRSILRVPTGRGWSLVGDAGFTEDPTSAHGIADALRDAELCAEAVDVSLCDPSLETEAQNHYQLTRDRFANQLFDSTSELASLDWDAAQASALMRRLGTITEKECVFLQGRRAMVSA